MVRTLSSILAALSILAATAEAQESVCGNVDGETHLLEGDIEPGGFFMPVLDADDGADATYRLTYCIEVWDDAGGYARWENLDGSTFPVVDGLLGQDDWGDDQYAERHEGDPELNPFLYPNESDLNFYVVNNDDGWMPGHEDYVIPMFWTSPYVTVHYRATMRWAPD